MRSSDMTRTQYRYEDDPKGNRIVDYKITTADGKVLMNQSQSFEVLGENKFRSSRNDKTYMIEFNKKNNSIDITDEKKIKIAYIFTKDKNPNLSQLNLILFRAVTNAAPLTDAGTLWMDENSIAQTVDNDVNWNLLHFGIKDFVQKLHKNVFPNLLKFDMLSPILSVIIVCFINCNILIFK